uniref:Pru domain-containing protein n=1 Tax=Paramoeba aestuarina TaxID=180227 RepID=A0A7S4KMU8_9EUKA|mmetsp:Transcript_21691/g.33719  ORF Transcript_21691/g.33719 Transcript_21691/m.33719 type:complete len:301 (+) Transcript_21691:173-1075(+)|eukprot:CAMPEP_0201519030 /NCGR_PEP_ID=MMETSP0161_2-20130828/9695_1 /ASSEMBLY_ACC=CAM_ASM_000251 /TAXON_ID=180227 /ORGANISM="Neoparamoeba aestuarina, Strain SoJaBio B1-5/56/2" /LENGTH=300 /DNA_ID=CAMNT_0047916951 /DNA_START=160 /DNA_END=1062 /DNA_ORIENTATION=-
MASNDEIVLEFNAGRCERDGKKVKPVQDKGVVQIVKEGNNVFFCWKLREASSVDSAHKHQLKGGQFEFRKIGAPTSRVYLLELKDAEKKLMFWMQHTDKAADNQILAKVKEFEAVKAEQSSQATLVSQQQNPTPQQPPQQPPQQLPQQPPQQPSPALQPFGAQQQGAVGANILGSILGDALRSMGVDQEKDQLSLLRVLSHLEDIFPVISDEKVQEELTPHLPPTLQTRTELYQTLSSPQFQEAVNSMEHVIQSGQLMALLGSSGISLEGVSRYGGTTAFLKAIQNQADKDKRQQEEGNS